ncbi:hypothetical protein RRG08_065044 [Elysia crispata]|uniref:VIT domain-containing protein n=1 Tax=Elysia crispata TaxID=231223 RepID=A0AAE0YXK2_9GAST|nr:hypothetical protein RRG08_065044 [Elysia crispata]
MLTKLCCGLVLLISFTTASPPTLPIKDKFDAAPSKRKVFKLKKVVESFSVRSDIRYRFATTQMSSVVRNVDAMAQEISFDVTLPENAFIMAFHMMIDGKRYDGQVKERKQAKHEYQDAKDRGQSAGHVRKVPRHANVFEVAVNMAAGSAVNFTLTYQEVLRRRRGIYEHEIHVNPGQPVQDFRIEVQIRENRPLKFVRTPALRTDFLLTNLVEDASTNDITLIERPSPEAATIVFTPDIKDQGDGKGISARFVVQYDVEHAGISGDMLVVDGYFVHFMVPDNISNTLPKDIIFLFLTFPVLYLSITYQSSSVDEFSLTDTEFPMVFNGTEIMICGLWKEGKAKLEYKITGLESTRKIEITKEVNSMDVMIVSPDEETDKP